MLLKFYKNQRAKVRVAGVLSDWFSVKRGIRQGCVLPPYLFNILAEMVMREALDGFGGGFAIDGRRLPNLRYADDIILIAGTVEELQDLVTRLEVASTEYGLVINADKTKVMATHTHCFIRCQHQ